MEITGSMPVKRVKDKALPIGREVVEEEGSTPSRTSVSRTVYAEDGTLISEETWNTSYKGETRIVRVGAKPKPKVPKPPTGEKPPVKTPDPLRLRPDRNGLGEPGRHAGRPVGLAIDRRMLRVAVRYELVPARDAVLVTKA